MIKEHKRTIREILGRDSVHPFPARMAPGIALEVLSNAKDQLRVLDPMSGSGTVLAVARANGHKAFGIDIDPLAVLISKVWTTRIKPAEVRKTAVIVLEKSKKNMQNLDFATAYPPGADAETKKFISYWFDPRTRRQLTALTISIKKVRDRNTRDVLWCAFSRLIIAKSNGASLAMDLSHSRPHKVYKVAPIDPFDKFIGMVEKVVENCITDPTASAGPASKINVGDARSLPFRKASIDFVLTSPPYLNAIDYIRCSKFSLVWMGFSTNALREIRSVSVGSEAFRARASVISNLKNAIDSLKIEKNLTARQFKMFTQYAYDMHSSIKEISRVLSPNGKAIYVVGENTIQGVYIPTAKLLSAIAGFSGLTLIEKRTRNLPENRRYLPPPKKGKESLNLRMRKEVVLVFTKIA